MTPFFIVTTRFLNAFTISLLWVTTRTVVPRSLISSRSFIISKEFFGSRLPVGSSARRILGRFTSALARALVNRPSILLADEPTGNLDPKNSFEIMKLLEEINERGTTVLVVTHNREIVNAFKKRVVTMKKGVIVSDEQEGEYLNEN